MDCSSPRAQMKKAIEPFEKIRKAVGDRMDIMVEFHSLWNLPTAKKIAQRARALCADVVRGSDPHELAAGAGRIRAIDGRLGLRERDARLALAVQGHAGARRIARRDGRSVLDRRADRRPQDRVAGGDVAPPVRAARLHRAGGIRRGRAHASFSQPNTLIQESVRAFYRGWYNELVTAVPRIEGGYVYPMEGPGLGVELQPAVFKRADLTVRRTAA